MLDILWFLASLVSLIAGGEPQLAVVVPSFSPWATVALACLPVYCTGRALARRERTVFIGHRVASPIPASRQHELLPRHSQVTLGFVIPLAITTLIVMQQPARP